MNCARQAAPVKLCSLRHLRALSTHLVAKALVPGKVAVLEEEVDPISPNGRTIFAAIDITTHFFLPDAGS